MDRRRKPAIREPRPHLTMEEMRSYLTSLKEIESVTGIRYIKLHVTAKMIIGIREASGKEFTINLDDLFRAYNECLRFTSPEVHLHGPFARRGAAQKTAKPPTG